MRVLVDANVFISYLIRTDADSPAAMAIRAGFQNLYQLVVSETTLEEIARSVSTKAYLRQTISRDEAENVAARIRTIASVLPPLTDSSRYRGGSRDPKDDYLLAHAMLEGVDVLLTGDRDLLELASFTPFAILSPREFLQRLTSETQMP